MAQHARTATKIYAEHAHEYTTVSWPIFPLAEGTKIPAIRGGRGFKDASCDSATIRIWASEHPTANIGIATGGTLGLVVIDIDPRHCGDDTIARLEADGFTFPRGPASRTGNGGRHLYCRLPTGAKINLFSLGAGIDVKAGGGYVVAPPSVIGPSRAGPGGRYVWIRNPWTTTLPLLPEWALDRLRPAKIAPAFFALNLSPQAALRRLDGIAGFVARAHVGNRNNSLNWAAFTAGALVREGLVDVCTVSGTLRAAAAAAGLTDHEIARTLDSALRASIERVLAS